MSQQLNLDFLAISGPVLVDSPVDTRNEARTQEVHMVEYAPYPRRARDERRRVGFTSNTSSTGMCIAVEGAEKPGTLLRVVGTNLDGDSPSDTLARVTWCEARSDSRFSLGLDVISNLGMRRMLKVRHAGRRETVAVHN